MCIPTNTFKSGVKTARLGGDELLNMWPENWVWKTFREICPAPVGRTTKSTKREIKCTPQCLSVLRSFLLLPLDCTPRQACLPSDLADTGWQCTTRLTVPKRKQKKKHFLKNCNFTKRQRGAEQTKHTKYKIIILRWLKLALTWKILWIMVCPYDLTTLKQKNRRNDITLNWQRPIDLSCTKYKWKVEVVMESKS